MPTTVLKKNEARVPFLGEKLSYIRGLDPLGLQITSEATYSWLLPGITNLTNHIRYYGFYCWLLDVYERDGGSTDATEQYNFIRRAELMIALLIQLKSPKTLAIPGSTYAAHMIKDVAGTFDLKVGADLRQGANDETYWKIRTGAFGQYYAGALRLLGLVTSITQSETVFKRTETAENHISGQALAGAFAEQVPPQMQQLFIGNVRSGRLRVVDVDSLYRYFNLAAIADDSNEQAMYLQLLTSQDHPLREEEAPARHRAATLQKLLAFLYQNERTGWLAFLLENYADYGSKGSSTLMGWYYYQLNEYWQFACGAILAAVLMELDKQGGSADLADFLADFKARMGQQLSRLDGAIDPDLTLGHVLDDAAGKLKTEEAYVYVIQQGVKDRKPVVVAVHGLLLIMQLYKHNAPQLAALEEFGTRPELYRDGNFWKYAKVLQTRREMPLTDFIGDFLHRQILSRHEYVAIRKLGNGLQSTLKFAIEDGFIQLLENILPMFSGPRLNVLLNMSRELHLVDGEGQLTPKGLSIIS